MWWIAKIQQILPTWYPPPKKKKKKKTYFTDRPKTGAMDIRATTKKLTQTVLI